MRARMVDFSLAIPLIISSALAAPLGAYFNVRIDTRPFLMILAAVLALAGGRMLMPPPKASEEGSLGTTGKIVSGILIGGIIGMVGGLLGIGGGVFIVPLLIFVVKTPTKIAAASSTFIVCFSSLTGFLGYASMATVDWVFILPAAVACFVGGQVGSRLMSAGMKGKSIRVIFSVILFLLCAKLLYQSFLQ